MATLKRIARGLLAAILVIAAVFVAYDVARSAWHRLQWGYLSP